MCCNYVTSDNVMSWINVPDRKGFFLAKSLAFRFQIWKWSIVGNDLQIVSQFPEQLRAANCTKLL